MGFLTASSVAFAADYPTLISNGGNSATSSSGMYFSIAAGAAWQMNSSGVTHIPLPGEANLSEDLVKSYGVGFTGNAAFGYRFNQYVRAELEGVYAHNRVKHVNWNNTAGASFSSLLVANQRLLVA